MAYVLPQVLVYQELQLIPDADQQPMPAHVSGGHAQLIRHELEDEKENGLLGFYDPQLDVCYEWPGRPAGGKVDPTYTQVHIDDALLKYFQDSIGAGDLIQTVAGRPNQVVAETLNWKANGVDYPRDPALKERDVQVGDVAKIRAIVDGQPYTRWTYVADFLGELVAAQVAAATSDIDNAPNQAAPAAADVYTGPDNLINCVDITAVNQTLYNGLEDGDINETYTITVLESSAAGDATTAVLRVTSASGNDDDDAVTPMAFGAPTPIGSRGLTVTWDSAGTPTCSLSAENNDISDIDFIPGQQWQVTCGQAFTAPAATSGGSYSGAEDVTYIVEVTKGGLYSTSPQITVTTDKGIDISGPTNITATALAVAIGTKGVTIAFNQTGLRKGDRYNVPAVAESEGAFRTLVLGHNLVEPVQAASPTEVDVTLYIKSDIVVSEARYGVPGQQNYTQSETEICLLNGLTATDPSWTEGGELEALPVSSQEFSNQGRVYVTTRYWLSELCGRFESVHDVALLDDAISGPLHPDNELKWGVFNALQNSGGVPVGYTSVCNPSDPTSWLDVLEVITGRNDVYGMVPLTKNKTVLDAFVAHLTSQSQPESGRWRVLWVNLEGVPEQVVVDSSNSSDEEVIMGTLQDDPNTSGTQYTILEVPAGNSNFLTNEVRPGDTVRFLYTTDGFGGELYTEFLVDEVVNEDSLRLRTGHAVAVNTPQKLEIHRNLSATEESEELGIQLGYSNRHIMTVWPDYIGSGGLTFPGYHLCAALAGLASGVMPHQGMTHLQINGFDDLSRTTDRFNRSQLDSMSEAGVFVVTQDPQSGAVFSRHAVTTAPTDDANQREEAITRNLDNISFYFQSLFYPYIGISNISESLLAVLRSEMAAGIRVLISRNYTQRLGGQLRDGEITSLREHATIKNRVQATLTLDLPRALNNLELHLTV